ncbi:MAG: BamA/TamA family outer membrane protein [Cyclobacteriaceae bacterium]
MKVFSIWWIGLLVCGLLFIPGKSFGQIRSAKVQLADTLDMTPIRINRIYILGNKKTKRAIITRELTIQEGDTIPAYRLPALFAEDRNKIYNTQLFNTVSIEQLQLDSTSIDLLVKVDERWYFYPSLLFKLSDRNFNDWWVNRNRDLRRVNYGFKLFQYNFRGRNELLRLVAQFGFETQVELNYRLPYIEPSQRHGLTFDVGYSERKNIAYQTEDHLPIFTRSSKILRTAVGGSVIHSYRPSFYTYHYTSLGFYSLHVADTIPMLNPNYFKDGESRQQAFRLAYTFTRDYRDNRNYPLSGDFYYFQIDKVGLGIMNDIDIWRFRANYSKYFDLSNGFYMANSMEGMIATPKNQPYNNYTSLGFGPTLVRGYELELIEGYQYFLSKNALRKRLWKSESDISRVMPLEQFQKIPFIFYGNIFFDVGWVKNYPNYEQSNRLSDRLLYGVGLGIDFITINDLTTRFEYSYNAENEFNFFLNFKAAF